MKDIIFNYPWFEQVLTYPELEDITLRNLYRFYFTNNNINIFISIITSNSDISIRIIDWFVTNYAKKYNIIYELDNYNDSNGYFNIYLQYKCQLKSYKKKLFDPFCRKNKIPFYYEEKKCVITTVGQLNFFKWAIENNILNYIKLNLQKITDDMMFSISKIKNNSTTSSNEDNISGRPKRHELSHAANKIINIHNYNITLSFE